MDIILLIYLLKNRNHHLFLSHHYLFWDISYYIDSMKNKKLLLLYMLDYIIKNYIYYLPYYVN